MKRSGLLLLLLAACLPLCAAGPGAAGEGVTFRFHPTDTSITLIDTEVRTDTQTMGSGKAQETTVTVTLEKSKTRIVKTAKGYTVTSITLSLRKAVNGVEEEPDGFDKAFMAVPVTAELNNAGRLIAFKGFGELRSKALELMEDEEERAFFEHAMTKERMELLAQGQWAAANHTLLGVTKRPGDTWTSRLQWSLFSPSLTPVTTDYAFIRMYNVGGHPCAMLKNTITPDLKTATRDLAKMFADLALLPEETDPKFTVESYTEEYIRYIDPATFITWKETESSTKRFTVTIDGQEIVTTETVESTTTTAVDYGYRET